MAVPIGAVTMADGGAATVCESNANGSTVEESGTTQTTIEG